LTAAGQVADAVDEVNNLLPDILAVATVEDTLQLLGELHAAWTLLGQLKASVEAEAARKMPKKRVEWAGGAAVRRRSAKRKEWLHDDLAHAVSRASLVNENGELPGDEVRRAVEKAVSSLMFAGSVSWRVGNLAQLGIDADQFCHSEPGRRTVEVHLGSPEATP
jgi:hypothetical protein